MAERRAHPQAERPDPRTAVFGAIAQAIGRRAAGFGLRVIASDPYIPASDIAARGAAAVSLDELLELSDYLVIQAPLTKETHHLIGVIMTPHAAYYSEEAIRTVRDFAANEVARVLTGQPPLSPVNDSAIAALRESPS